MTNINLTHKDVGTQLSKTEWEAADTHVVGTVTNDTDVDTKGARNTAITTHATIANTHYAAWDDLIIDADGAVDITGKTGRCFRLHPNGAETEDELNTIIGGLQGQEIHLTGNSDGYPITLISDSNDPPYLSFCFSSEAGIVLGDDVDMTVSFISRIDGVNGEDWWMWSGSSAPQSIVEAAGLSFSSNPVGLAFSSSVLTSDHTSTGKWSNAVVGETFTAAGFQIGYKNADGEVYLAKADSSTTMPAFCMKLWGSAPAPDGNTIETITWGYVRDDTWNWTVGGLLYVSKDTAGAMTQTKPVYPNIAQVIGIAWTADIIYFNPSLFSSNDMVDITIQAVEDTGLVMTDTKNIEYDPSPAASHTANGRVVTLTAGTALVFGNACYMGTDGKMEKALADDAAVTIPATHLCIATIAENSTGLFLEKGWAHDDSWAFDIGLSVYLSPSTAGLITKTMPVKVTGNQVQVLGFCGEATDTIYWNPSPIIAEYA